ncbi:UNKNOWN [Stylonychia lemnae]|uniref:Uncharacterized protein n=1 Tax=Stylonychia lemnae TaxID=5949 RepID=A0A078B5L9_STYLE|nr:UNKNOWN [Stylonychia lemnae]|eukprot:CDW89501.1 UNKNOWN [Stylonychia lemnae]
MMINNTMKETSSNQKSSSSNNFQTNSMQNLLKSHSGNRSKILLYQKGNMGSFRQHQESSAVSSVSNTAYGTLYHDQFNNRLQSQYFNHQNHQNKDQSAYQNGNANLRTPQKQGQRSKNQLGNYKRIQELAKEKLNSSNDQQQNSHYNGLRGDSELQQRKSYKILNKPTTAQIGIRKLEHGMSDFQVGEKVIQNTQYASNNNVNRQSLQRLNDIKEEATNARPKTMGGRLAGLPSRQNYQSSQDNKTTMASDGFIDPRLDIRQKKQRIQSTFYETLRQGQQMNVNSINKLDQSAITFSSKKKSNNLNPDLQNTLSQFHQGQNANNTMQSDLNTYNIQLNQARMASGLSLKQNNLKYHLMRQLLQKKNLDEITQLQLKMAEQYQITQEESPSKPIQLPGMKRDVSPISKGRHKSISSSSSSSSQSEDVEPFVDQSQSSHVTPALITQQTNNQPLSQTPLPQNQINSHYHHGSQVISNGQLLNQLPTHSHSALGQIGIHGNDSSTGNMVLNSSFNINIIKNNLSKKTSMISHYDRTSTQLRGINDQSIMQQYPDKSPQQQDLLSKKKRTKSEFMKQAQANDLSLNVRQYNYCGVPDFYLIDQKNIPVHQRKKRLETSKKIQINKGCGVFNHRNRKADALIGIAHPNKTQLNQFSNQSFEDVRMNEYEYLSASNNSQLDNYHRPQYNFGLHKSFENRYKNQIQMMTENQSEDPNFGYGSLENKKAQLNVEFNHKMQEEMNVERLMLKDEQERVVLKQKKTELIKEEIRKSKMDCLPNKLQKTYDKLQNMYPQFGYDTADPQQMQFIEEDQKIYKILKEEAWQRQVEFRNLQYAEPIGKKNYRFGLYSASTSTHKFKKGRMLNDFLGTKQSRPNTNQINDRRGEMTHFQNEPMFIKQLRSPNDQDQKQQNPEDIFELWGTINANFSHILNPQKFGDFLTVNKKEELLVKTMIFERYPVLRENNVSIKVAKLIPPISKAKQLMISQTESEEDQDLLIPEFNALLYGSNCPLSKCCKLSLCINLNLECGTSKIMCMERLCQFNPQQQFLIPSEILVQFYDEKLIDKNVEIQMRRDLVVSGKSNKKDELIKQKEMITQELKRNVVAGSFKFKSLRNVVSRGGRPSASRPKPNPNKPDFLDDQTTENDYELIDLQSDINQDSLTIDRDDVHHQKIKKNKTQAVARNNQTGGTEEQYEDSMFRGEEKNAQVLSPGDDEDGEIEYIDVSYPIMHSNEDV